FFGLLLDLLAQDAEVRDHLLVFSNPTLRRQQDGTLVFLLMNGVRETFQRLPSNPALELIQEVLEAGDGPRTVLQLIEELDRRPELSVPIDQIRTYVEKLMLIGFLRLTTGIPAQEVRWDLALEELLDGIDHQPSRNAIQLVRRLRRLTEEFARATGQDRVKLLQQMDDSFDTFREQVGDVASVRTAVYEDATSSSAGATLRRSAPCRALERELGRYVELTSRLSPHRGDLANMRHFFETHYGSGAPNVPLLTFYEDYYREHYKAHLQREAEGRRPGEILEDGYDMSNPFGLDLVDRINAAHGRLVRFLGQRYGDSPEDLTIDFTDLEQIVEDVPAGVRSCDASVMFFGELGAREELGDERFVVRGGSYYPGYGKMFSRFLYLFPDSFEETLRESNEGLTSGILAELGDDANFNANLHPPLLPAEISYPVGEGRQQGNTISTVDLEIFEDPADPYGLALLHRPTGQRVFPVDLGFLSSRLRPPLYRLLAAFMPAPTFGLPAPEAPSQTSKATGQLASRPSPGIERRPRVRLGQHLLLHRRSWLVPASHFPHQADAESDAAYFERIERWRQEHRIPSEVYVRIHQVIRHPPSPETDSPVAGSPEAATADAGQVGAEPDGVGETEREGKAAAKRREAMKPQFIDFRSPLLLGLFARLPPAGHDFTAILEERLPASPSLATHDGDSFVTEVILQLNVPASA
ncbi:MAG: lantibiotic dehydratase family protein, partial [Holophagales bacterium]|nr:lantibiotic dehydratase family protein [Holophagales bacterium]